MEEVRELYLDHDYNCAETVLRRANERYGLNIAEEDMKLISGFGGGLCCGRTCGTLCAAIAVLGKLKVAPRAHATPGFKELCTDFVNRFERELGSVVCKELKEQYQQPGVRCLKTVEIADELLNDFVQQTDV